MKEKLICFFYLFCCFPYINAAKPVKITTEPTDAKVFVDGKWYADETPVTIKWTKGDFMEIRVEKPGYETLTRRLYKSSKVTSYSFKLLVDPIISNGFDPSIGDFGGTRFSANQYFTIKVSEKYISVAGGDTDKASQLAWKMMHEILLNYFDELGTTDMLSGRITTPWHYTKFLDAGIQVRTRVIIQETNLGSSLSYKIKIVSEKGAVSALRDDQFAPIPVIMKRFAPMIEEFQARLGIQ